jgi:hypothetical protein
MEPYSGSSPRPRDPLRNQLNILDVEAPVRVLTGARRRRAESASAATPTAPDRGCPPLAVYIRESMP